MKKIKIYYWRANLKHNFEREQQTETLIDKFKTSSIYYLNPKHGNKTLTSYHNRLRRIKSRISILQSRLRNNLPFIKLNCPRVSRDLEWCFK